MATHIPHNTMSVAEEVAERLILDGTKLAWHEDRVRAWERGERIAPITIDMALTRACDATCSFCYAMLQESSERKYLDKQVMDRFLNDCAEIGVKAISLVSDGESVLSPTYEFTVQRGYELGINMASGTNGWKLDYARLEQVLPFLTYIRFNVSGGTPERYAEIMFNNPKRTDVFDNAMDNIRAAVDIKRRFGLNVTIGTQMVLMPQDADQIIPFAALSLDLGVDYGIIKHCSDDEKGSLGVDYSKYPALYPALRQAESMGTERTQIHIKWSKIGEGAKRSYARCYGPPFLLQISGSGLVAPCGMLFNSRYSKFWIGNIVDEGFKSIWQSERYWDVMRYLGGEHFDARWMCGALCLQHRVNDSLDRHVKGQPIQFQAARQPSHVNFI